MPSHRLTLLTIATGCIASSLQSHGATFTWDGGGNGNLGGAANWNPDGSPPNDGSADMIFSGSTHFTPNAQTAYTINTLLFSNISGLMPFTIGGEKITFVENGGLLPFIRNETSYSNGFSNALEFHDSTIVRAQSGNLTFGNTFITGPTGGGGHTVTLTADSGRTITMNGVTGGTGHLRIMGAGIVRFNSANIISGNLEVLGTAELDATIAGPPSITVGGTIRLASANRISSVPITLSGYLVLNSFQETIGALSGNGNISMGTNGDLRISQNSDSTFSGTISGAGNNNSLRKEGTGVLTLGGTSSYIGTTTVAGGTLRLSTAAAIAPFANLVVETGAVFDVNGRTISVPSLTGEGTLHLPNVSELSIGGLNESFAYAGSLTGTGTLTKTGSGTLQLAKGGGTFSGVINLAGGITELREMNVGGSNTRISVGNGSTLQVMRGKSQSLQGGLFLNGSGVGGLGALRFTNEGTSNSGIHGPVTLVGNSTIVSDSPFAVVVGGEGDDLTFGTRNLTLSGTGLFELRNDFTGSGTLHVNGGSRIQIKGDNSAYTGRINLTDGEFSLLHDNALGSGSQPVNVAGGSLISLGDGTDVSTERTLTLAGGGLWSVADATCSWSSTAPIESAGQSLIQARDGSTMTLSGSGAITGENGLRFSVGTNAVLTLAKNASAGGGEFEKLGSGELLLQGRITSSSKIAFKAGKITLGANERIPNAADIEFTGGTILSLNGFTEAVGGIYGAGEIQLDSSTLTISPSGAYPTFINYGTISGSGNVVIDAAVPGRHQIFNVANTYTGTTTIRNGAILELRSAGGLSPTAQLTVSTGSVLRLGAAGQVVGSLVGNGNVVHTSSEGVLEVGGENVSAVWSGTIEGPGGLRKGGFNAGFTMLTPQLHTGPTRVMKGTMVSMGLPFSALTIDAATGVSASGLHASIDCSGMIGNYHSNDVITAGTVILRAGSTIEMNVSKWSAPAALSAETLERFGGNLRVKGHDLGTLLPGETVVMRVVETTGGISGVTGGNVTLFGSLASFDGTAIARVRGNNLEVVFTAAGNPDYLTWIHGYDDLLDPDRDEDADPDRDGIPNIIEFLIGGDPALRDDSGSLPEMELDGTHLKITYRRMKRSIYLDPLVEHSPDLQSPWTKAIHGSGGVTISETPVDETMDIITVRIPRGSSAKKFARLRMYASPG